MKAILIFASAALLLVATACKQDLAFENLSNPDIARVFATRRSVEATIGAGYQTVHNAITNQNDQPGVEVFGLESYSELNNFNMGTRVSIPRLPINNVNGAPTIFHEFSALAKEARLVVNAMDALDALNKAGKTIATAQRDKRARSFGFFVAGVSMGWLAIMYDSAAIVERECRPIRFRRSVPRRMSVRRRSRCSTAPSPSPTNPAMTGARSTPLVQHCRSDNTRRYKRIIRSYARNPHRRHPHPAQRTAVDWTKVIDDAENGFQRTYGEHG